MQIKDQVLWQKCQDNNQDDYRKAINEFAERWANLMEKKMADGETLHEIAMQTSHETDTDGITGFMFGAAVNTLAEVPEHGEALRQWHNAVYEYEGKGIVNPTTLYVGAEPT